MEYRKVCIRSALPNNNNLDEYLYLINCLSLVANVDGVGLPDAFAIEGIVSLFIVLYTFAVNQYRCCQLPIT